MTLQTTESRIALERQWDQYQQKQMELIDISYSEGRKYIKMKLNIDIPESVKWPETAQLTECSGKVNNLCIANFTQEHVDVVSMNILRINDNHLWQENIVLAVHDLFRQRLALLILAQQSEKNPAVYGLAVLAGTRADTIDDSENCFIIDPGHKECVIGWTDQEKSVTFRAPYCLFEYNSLLPPPPPAVEISRGSSLIQIAEKAGREHLQAKFGVEIKSAGYGFNNVLIYNETEKTIVLSDNNFPTFDGRTLIQLGRLGHGLYDQFCDRMDIAHASSINKYLKLLDNNCPKGAVAFFLQPYLEQGNTHIYGLILPAGTREDSIGFDHYVEIDPDENTFHPGWIPAEHRTEEFREKLERNEVSKDQFYNEINIPDCAATYGHLESSLDHYGGQMLEFYEYAAD